MIDPTRLSEAMRSFKNAEPQHYEKFIRVLDQYVTELTVAVTDAPASEILVSQGRAQQGRKFFQLFTELPE